MSQPKSNASREVGLRVRSRRHELGLSQMDLGELSGIHFTNIGKVERGDVSPTLGSLLRIATALDLSPAVLVQGLSADDLPQRPHRVTAADLIRARNESR